MVGCYGSVPSSSRMSITCRIAGTRTALARHNIWVSVTDLSVILPDIALAAKIKYLLKKIADHQYMHRYYVLCRTDRGYYCSRLAKSDLYFMVSSKMAKELRNSFVCLCKVERNDFHYIRKTTQIKQLVSKYQEINVYCHTYCR